MMSFSDETGENAKLKRVQGNIIVKDKQVRNII